jgi:epoxyqueuosine reductase QueG
MDSNWIEHVIAEFIKTSPANTLKLKTGESAWEEAIVGFASGADPIFEDFKMHVGPFHFTPAEIFNLTFRNVSPLPQELTVVSWVLPQREATKADNRAQNVYPSERWVMARFPGEDFNILLRQHVVEELAKVGVPAVAPQLSPEWRREDSPRHGFASRWSERHIAHAAGLGTFGVCDGLITRKGKAHRVGSVVAGVRIDPTPRPYAHHRAWCLFFAKGNCLVCTRRCPVGAISENGHDKKRCRDHIRETCGAYVKENFGFDGYGCGLCQTAVPCESGIPKIVSA